MIQYTKHTEKLTSRLKIILVLFIFVFLTNTNLIAGNSTGDYRSAASGNWSTLTSWERYNGSAWVTPTAAQGSPGIITVCSNIAILSGHTITFDVTNSYDIGSGLLQVDGEMIVSAIIYLQKNANVVINGRIRFTGNNYISQFANGLGVAANFSLNSSGILETQNTEGLESSGQKGSIQIIPGHNTVNFSSGAKYIYNGRSNQKLGDALPDLTSGGTLTLNTGGVVTLIKPLIIGSGATCTVSASDTLVAAYTITKSGDMFVNGALQLNSGGSVSSSPTYGSTSTLVYNQGGTATFGSEWTTKGTTSGIGVPQNVTIQNNTTVTLPTTDRGLAGNLNINSGTLNLNSIQGNLYVGGNWTRLSSGTFNPNGRTVYFSGASTATIKAPETTTRDVNGGFGGEKFDFLNMNKTTLATEVKLLSNITITKTLTLTMGTLNLDTSDVLLPSNVTTTADVAAVNTSNATISYSSTGRFIAQRYIKNTSTIRTWRFLTAPLQATDTLSISSAWQGGMINTNVSTPSVSNPWPGFSTQITGPTGTYNSSLGFDKGMGNNGYSIEYYDNSGATAKWGYPANTNATRLMSKYAWGVFIRGDRSFVIGNQYTPSMNVTLEPRGKINIGQISETVVAGKTNLVGNPYPCQINMTNVNIGGAVHQQYKLWDPKAFSNYSNTGKYITFTWISGTTYAASNAPVTTWAKPGTVESSEAFFVTPATGTIIFHEYDKVSGTSTLNGIQSRPTDNPTDKVSFFRSDLAYYDDSVANYVSIDGTLNLYNNSYNTDVDAYEDAVAQMSGSTTGAIRIFKNGKQLSISKEQPLADVDTVFFNLSTLKQIKHQLVFTFTDFLEKKSAVLIDKYLSKETFISTNNTDTSFYDFEINGDAASNASDRFMVVFRPMIITPVKFIDLNGVNKNSEVQLTWVAMIDQGFKHFEVEYSSDGNNFKTIAIINGASTGNSKNTYSYTHTSPISGVNYYRLKSVDINGVYTYSNSIAVKVGVTIGIVNAYPNPFTDRLDINFQSQYSNKISIRMIDILGKTIRSMSGQINIGNNHLVVGNLSDLQPGAYNLEIVDLSDNTTYRYKLIKQ